MEKKAVELKLVERQNWKGENEYWIYNNGYAEIPIYREKDLAEEAYNKMLEYHQNPPEDKVLKHDTI